VKKKTFPGPPPLYQKVHNWTGHLFPTRQGWGGERRQCIYMDQRYRPVQFGFNVKVKNVFQDKTTRRIEEKFGRRGKEGDGQSCHCASKLNRHERNAVEVKKKNQFPKKNKPNQKWRGNLILHRGERKFQNYKRENDI